MPKSSKPKSSIEIDGNVSGTNVTIGNGNTVNNTNIIQPPPAPDAHPALGSIPPASADTYVHRGQIEDDIRAALRKGGASAIVGLHAPGGTGKTELANRVAQEVRDGKLGFESVLWLDVNEKTPQEVLNEGLRKCGLQLPPTANAADQKAEWQYYLSSRKLLVIFDDVRENAREGLKALLPPAPCAALITSRIQQMAGVREFALDHMEPEQARALFVNSLDAEAVQAEEEMVLKLAERCKYNPLALEIASRRIRQNINFTNPIARYFEKAEKRFEELKMHGDERWNMTGVFDLSYHDLTEADQKYFRALAVFAPTGFAPNAAAHVWEMKEQQAQAGDILSRFQNLSLVIPVAGNFERFRLHDLLDEYAAPKLRAAGAEEKTTGDLAEWLINLFDEHYTDDFSNAPEVGLEFPNLAKTAEWAIEKRKGDLLASLATKPRNWLYNYFRELADWQRWLETSLKIDFDDNQLKANVLQAIGDVQQFRDDRDAALESYNEALKLFQKVGAKLGEANVRKAIGDVQQFRDDRDAALESYNEALKLFQKVGDKLGEANVRKAIGDVQQFRDDRDAALESYSEALKLFQKVGDKLGEANVLAALSRVAIGEGRLNEAEQQLEQIIQMRRLIGSLYDEGADYGNFSITLLNAGYKEKAKGYAEKARLIFEKIQIPAVVEMMDRVIAACDA